VIGGTLHATEDSPLLTILFEEDEKRGSNNGGERKE